MKITKIQFDRGYQGQLVPVKIVLDDLFGADVALGPGMSVEPKVRVR